MTMVARIKRILVSVIKIFILKNCSPRSLEVCEHRFIQSLRTIGLFGINTVDPFGLPLLDPPSYVFYFFVPFVLHFCFQG